MRPEPSRRPGILSDRYEPLLDRFRDHARSLIQARAAAEDDATSARRAADAEIDERVAAFDLLLSEVSALAESVVSHPAARNLSEVDSAPVPTVYDDPSIDLLRGLYMRRRERAFAVLPDLSVPATARRDAAMAPTADAKGTPRPDDGAHTFSESDREGGAPDGGTPPAELPVVASVPASTPSADVADAGNAPSGTEVVRCPHCAAEAPIGAEFCPACTRRMRGYLAPNDEAVSTASADVPPWWGAGRARWAIALVALLAVSIGGLNLWPGALVRVAFLCSAPGLSSLIPCNRVVTGTPGVPPTVAEDPVPTRVLTSSSQLAAAIATVGQAGSGTLSVGEGVFEIQAPVVLSGNVTIRGVAPERSVLRLVSATGGILYRGDGTLSIADIGIVLVTSGAGDVLTIGGGTARLERIAVTGGRPGGGVAGAGLVFVGGATGSARDCIVQANEFGVWIANQATPSISRCTIASNLARGVSFHGDSGGELIGNTIEGNGYARTRDDHWQGVALQDSAAPSIRDNTIRDNAGIGVQYRDTSGGNFSGNRVSGNGWNIQRYADATASAGGLAIGTRNTNHQPTPTIGSGNTYSNNYGGNVIDYR